ncbi:MAG: twin-arginine translocase subunit TatC [Opitutaceae bacterium]|nr:twin-arginine translocase subunit TatC [Opitutaceae bacterium]
MRSQDYDDTADEAPEGEPGEKVMGFLDHLEELRLTLFKCVVAFVVGAVAVGFYFDEVKAWLDWPLQVGRERSGHPDAITMITSTLMAPFSVYISVGFLGALTLSMPFILLFLGQFIAPALTTKEKRLLIPGGLAALFLFLAGGAFAFFLLLPSVVDVSITANVDLGANAMLSLDSWYSTVAWMVLGMGAAFQFPMIIQIVVFLGLMEVATLRKWRRVALIICMVAAALITPTPDPVNMMVCTAPLYLLYEVAIIVAVLYTSKLAARSQV